MDKRVQFTEPLPSTLDSAYLLRGNSNRVPIEIIGQDGWQIGQSAYMTQFNGEPIVNSSLTSVYNPRFTPVPNRLQEPLFREGSTIQSVDRSTLMQALREPLTFQKQQPQWAEARQYPPNLG